jgi:hypothetical protein
VHDTENRVFGIALNKRPHSVVLPAPDGAETTINKPFLTDIFLPMVPKSKQQRKQTGLKVKRAESLRSQPFPQKLPPLKLSEIVIC